MSRRCQCHRQCRHSVRGSDEALLPAERLAIIDDPILKTLVDAADAFDADSLTFDPACGIHGTHPARNSECICSGTRYSALEFIEALALDVRAAKSRIEPAGRPGRKDASVRPLSLAATG